MGGLPASAFQLVGSYAVTTGPNSFAGTQTISSGDLSISSGDLYLPWTTGAGVGVIRLGGPGGQQFAHNFGAYNTFLGPSSGNFTMTGTRNTATGSFTLSSNAVGSDDTANGTNSLYSNTTGSFNTALGTGSLYYNTSASNNTAIGTGALSDDCQGVPDPCGAVNNTAVGRNAGVTANSANANVSGSNNTFIGYNSGPGTSVQLNNATAIGANALVSASNALVLGSIGTNVGIGTTTPTDTLQIDENSTENSDSLLIGNNSTKGLVLFDKGTGVDIASIGVPLDINFLGNQYTIFNAPGSSSGYVGIGTNSPDNLLSVNGSADKPGGGSWGTYSDARLKTVGDSYRAGLPEVLKLNPIYYRYKEKNALGIADHDQHVGLVAQEVEKVIPEAVSKNNKGYLLLNNDPILWAMVNAIKQQQALIEKQAEEIRAQQAQIAQLVSQTRVIQAALAGKSASRLGMRATRNAVPPVKRPKAKRPNAQGGSGQLVGRVSS